MIDRRSVPEPETTPDWQRIARQEDHRQWAPPVRPWLIRQTWRQLLFAHWPVTPAALRSLIPAQLDLDTFGGDAWVGVVPFELSSLSARQGPHRLRLTFAELNVRTYVTLQDKPGVWFFSLDAASLLAVRGARAAYHLPYYWASMQMAEQDGWIAYHSRRRGNAAARFSGRYRPTGPVFESAPESMERWLTARYCLYTTGRAGDILRAEINHDPWLLQPAEAEIAVNTMVSAQGIALSGFPVLHFARHTDVVNWGLERVV
jgi:uncharacterized protein YqjF (DUF2071 family)